MVDDDVLSAEVDPESMVGEPEPDVDRLTEDGIEPETNVGGDELDAELGSGI